MNFLARGISVDFLFSAGGIMCIFLQEKLGGLGVKICIFGGVVKTLCF